MIADKVQGSHSLSCGTVCHRTGVQPMEPKGASWDYGIGVSAAGVTPPEGGVARYPWARLGRNLLSCSGWHACLRLARTCRKLTFILQF